MHYSQFVIPFTAGMIILIVLLVFRYIKWLGHLEPGSLAKIGSNIFSVNTFYAIREVFMESLIHRKVFRNNRQEQKDPFRSAVRALRAKRAQAAKDT